MRKNRGFLFLLLVSALFLTGGCGGSSHDAGSLDVSFGTMGVTSTDLGDSACGYSVAVDQKGRIALGGSVSGDFALTRYMESGQLDPSFGEGGIVSTDIEGFDRGRSIAVDRNGLILMGGSCNVLSDSDFALVRYTESGRLDSSFGDGGMVSIDLGGYENVASIAIDQKGNIIEAGVTSYFSGEDFVSDLVLVRYSASGELDDTFGINGVVRTSLGGSCYGGDVLIDHEGRIVLCGDISSWSEDSMESSYPLLVRYTESGQLDPSFGVGGVVSTDLGDLAFGSSVAVDQEGRILLAGQIQYGDIMDVKTMKEDFVLLRYTDLGELDESFGRDGAVIFNVGFYDIANSVAVDSAGRILLGGSSRKDYNTPDDFTLLRYRASGELDPYFGTGGIAVSDFGGDNRGCSIAIDEDGKVVMGGYSIISEGENKFRYNFNVARYLSD